MLTFLKLLIPAAVVVVIVIVATVPTVVITREKKNEPSTTTRITTRVLTPMMPITTHEMLSTINGSISTMMTTTPAMVTAGTRRNLTTATTASSISTTTSTALQSRVSTTLASNGPTFCHSIFCDSTIFFYQAFQFTAPATGYYTIVSTSSLDTYGYLYNNSFNPSFLLQNLIAYDDDGNGGGQFRLAVRLQTNMRYVVMATTYFSNTTGDLTIIATGPTALSFSQLVVTYNWNNSTETTLTAVSVSNRTGSYCRFRDNCRNTIYYVSLMVFSVPVTGLYSIVSNSSVRMFGTLYDNVFFSNATDRNVLVYDDGSVSNNQFNFTIIMENIGSLILAMTTYDPGVSVNFTVTFRRLAMVSLTDS